MPAYYNEFDPFAAAWLRELIKAGRIADGVVDERSIVDVSPSDLSGFTQCHFFAGIGVWSYALRNAGWPDDRPVWTGSCPCQPFSVAGKGKGKKDERHLWPDFARLIGECRPPVVFGEQVASKAGRAWLDDVRAEMEALAYGVGATDFCAAGVGAPHIRQRLYWVGHSVHAGLEGHAGHGDRKTGRQGQAGPVAETGFSGGLADADRQRPAGEWVLLREKEDQRREAGVSETTGRDQVGAASKPSPLNGFWRDADWLFCRDGKWRAVEPGTFPLAHGAAARVGRLRGYGNAIVAPQAQIFIETYLEATEQMI